MISNYAKLRIFFQETVKTLRIRENTSDSYFHRDPVNNAIRKYENHPSVKKISEIVTITSTFYFLGFDKADVENSIGNLNSSMAETLKKIPTKCLKVTSDICRRFLETKSLS